ncbi:MAG TPA: hypothetical protein VEK15_17835 [Vicinamibacteria bacterium]|nr:hypothetical protein [Vicinamibacteria bacterium]
MTKRIYIEKSYWETTMKNDDKGIQAVRDVRKKISAEFDNDPDRLVEHYILEQERYRERLLKPVAAPLGEPLKSGSRRRPPAGR